MCYHNSHLYAQHDEFWLLLPWHVNGSLEFAEAERMQAHLQTCTVCNREYVRQLQSAKGVDWPALALSNMPTDERIVLVLTYQYKMGYQEISNLLGYSADEIKLLMIEAKLKAETLFPKLLAGHNNTCLGFSI